jgi:hypothetical protein
MKDVLSLIIFCSAIVLVQWSCNLRSRELEIPNTEYNIQVKFIEPVRFGENYALNFFNIDYEAKYRRSLYESSYIIKNVGNKTMKIRYSGSLNETLILVKYFGESDSGRACFIIWHDSSERSFYSDGFKITRSIIPSIEIGEKTEYLETNIDPLIIKRMYPKLRCKITYTKYKKIIVDCLKNVQDLELFENIKFVE